MNPTLSGWRGVNRRCLPKPRPPVRHRKTLRCRRRCGQHQIISYLIADWPPRQQRLNQCDSRSLLSLLSRRLLFAPLGWSFTGRPHPGRCAVKYKAVLCTRVQTALSCWHNQQCNELLAMPEERLPELWRECNFETPKHGDLHGG